MGNSLYDNIAVNANDINKRSKVLLDQVLELKKEQDKLDEKRNCEHIWFISKCGYAEHFDDFMFHYACAKCGQVMVLGEKIIGPDKNGKDYYIDAIQDKDFVMSVYQNLASNNPGIDNLGAALLLENYVKTYNDATRAERNGRN